MAKEEHLSTLKQGVQVWNRWRGENLNVAANLIMADLNGRNLTMADLTMADLREADLSGANLSRAVLRGANLSRAVLRGANLVGAVLRGANLREANLNRAHLGWADLREADLRGTDLAGTDLSKADLSKADLSWANLGSTVFGDVDLRQVHGLDHVNHVGPSIIAIDTIYRSEGKIPEAFLRGAGVPASFITFMQSLVAANAIQFYSCFISYSTKDEEFAIRLHADLQAKGVRCWFAPEDVQGGQKLYEQIDEAIRYHDKLLLVLSENSMNSEWVKTEIRRARKQEVRAGCRKLFPISLVPYTAIKEWEAFDADIGKDMAVEIREYFVPDFTYWKEHDSYQHAFQRLLRDLKAVPEGDGA